MIRTTLCIALVPFALATVRSADLEAEARALLRLDRCTILRLDLPLHAAEPFSTAAEIGGMEYVLDLAPHSVRADDFRVLEQRGGRLVEVGPGHDTTLRGDLVGDPGGWVAASLVDEGLWARVQTAAGDTWWIEPLLGRVPGVDRTTHVLYSSLDTSSNHGWCGTPDAPDGGSLDDDDAVIAGESFWVAEIAADCDHQFHNAYGGTTGAVNRVTAVINAMTPQWENQINVTYEITAIIVRTSNTDDPYDGTDPNSLLLQFKHHWQANHGGVQRDVAELFTGRNLDGSVIGIAYPGGICNFNGYNVVQNLGGMSCATDLSAHELGHNWNASHCSCSGFTMNPSLTCGNQFTTATRTKIINFRKTLDCLHLGFDGSELFFDGFESGDLTAGGWTRKNTKSQANGQAEYDGQFGANIKRRSWIAKALDTTGATAVQVELAYRVRSYEAGEALHIEWSGDGGATWNPVADLTSNTWIDKATFALPAGAANNPGFALRIRGGGMGKNSVTGKNKRAHVDNVRVIGE